jgi:hypothetical protein
MAQQLTKLLRDLKMVCIVCKYGTYIDADWLVMCGHELHVENRDPAVRQRQIEMAERILEVCDGKMGEGWTFLVNGRW